MSDRLLSDLRPCHIVAVVCDSVSHDTCWMSVLRQEDDDRGLFFTWLQSLLMSLGSATSIWDPWDEEARGHRTHTFLDRSCLLQRLGDLLLIGEGGAGGEGLMKTISIIREA